MGIRILVVDDATFIRDMIKKQLRETIPGVEVIDAPDGLRALAQLKNQVVDLILSDWEMPNMTGAELLGTVRAMPNGEKTPFIMISSRGDRSHIVKAIGLGVSDYLTKPFSAEELLKKVFKQLKAIDKLPTRQRATGAATQGIAFASVNVLTGGRGPAANLQASDQPGNDSARTDSTADSAQATGNRPNDAKPEATRTAKGMAQLRFANNRIVPCVIREMSLQAINCLMQRTDPLPGLFEQAVVDIETGDGNNLARVNGYVHSIQAGENRPETQVIKITIRFVDNDTDKFEALSKYIAQR